MAHAEWDPTALRQLAADLRRFTEAVRGYDCSRIKRLAAELGLEAAEMEASNARRLYNQKAGTNPICLALGHAQPDPSANAVRVGGGPESLALDAPYEPIDSLHERRAVRRTVVLIVIPRAIAQRIVGPV